MARDETGREPGGEDRSAAAARLAGSELARRTRQEYRKQCRRFDEWRDGRPPTDALVADYLAWMFERGLAPATAAQAVAAIVHSAKTGGALRPVGQEARMALRGFRRDGAERGAGQVDGIVREDAERMAKVAEREGGVRGLRDALLIYMMSDCLLRVAEAEALNVEDISFGNNGLRVLIRKSKTDPQSRGAVQLALPEAARLLRRWLAVADIESGPLFRPVNKAGRVGEGRLTGRSVREIVRKRAEAVGVDGRVSGHSLRIGAARSLLEAGATLAELMQAGRWKSSSMVALYTRGQAAERGAVARLWGNPPGSGRNNVADVR